MLLFVSLLLQLFQIRLEFFLQIPGFGYEYSLIKSFAFQRCQCVVGKVSIHPLKALPIGSPNRARWMGIMPR